MNYSYHRWPILPASNHNRSAGVKTRRQPELHIARFGDSSFLRRGLLRITSSHTARRVTKQSQQCTRMHTLAPSLAKTIAVAFPIPDDAPVTSAAFPSNFPPMTNDLFRLCLKMSTSV